MGILGGTAGGITASKQQSQINTNICDLATKMAKYKNTMVEADSALLVQTANTQQQVTDLAFQISSLQDDIRLQHQQFKKTYMYWVIAAIIFLMILVFMFASKKILLKATTEPN